MTASGARTLIAIRRCEIAPAAGLLRASALAMTASVIASELAVIASRATAGVAIRRVPFSAAGLLRASALAMTESVYA
jgi:hypothetical protein